mgnify:FL=1
MGLRTDVSYPIWDGNTKTNKTAAVAAGAKATFKAEDGTDDTTDHIYYLGHGAYYLVISAGDVNEMLYASPSVRADNGGVVIADHSGDITNWSTFITPGTTIYVHNTHGSSSHVISYTSHRNVL